MHKNIERQGHPKLSASTIHGVLSNMDITCKRICRVPRERNTETAIAERREWAVTFNQLRDCGCKFLFVDESGFNINMSRGRGYARVSETPECHVPAKGPNISLVAAMGEGFGLVHEVHKGGITAVIFAEFLRDISAHIREWSDGHPVVIVMDNARIHKTSVKDGINIPRIVQDMGFYHLYTVPYSPQLNAIESVFAQVKSYVVAEFVQHPEARKNLLGIIDSSVQRVTPEHIRNYCAHQARNVTLCLANIPLRSDDVIFDFTQLEEALAEEYEQDQSLLLREIRMYMGRGRE